MSGITLSAGVRANLLQLQRTASLTQITQERLSTGRDVNSALDNPSNFFTSQSLNNRASDLASLLDSMGGAINTVNAADQAITAITKLVETAAATARQALSEGSSYENEVTSTVLSEVAGGTGTTRENILANTLQGATATANTITKVTLSQTDDKGVAKSFDIAVDGTTTVQQVVDKINASGLAEASVTDDGKLKITSTDPSTELTLDGADDADVQKLVAGATDETAAALVKVDDPDATISATRAKALETQFNELRSQIDKLVKDAGFNGTNLLQGDDLKVIFNEKVGDKQSNLKIKGVDFDPVSLGVPTKNDVAFTDGASLEKVLEKLDGVIDTLRDQQQAFGSNLSIVQIRKDFTQEMVNTLMKGADELVLADTNEEGANLLALQTRQQLSSTALGLANRADQAVLQLF